MITFTLPFPPSELSPNDHDHNWRQKATVAARYRLECGRLAKSARVAEGGVWPLQSPVSAVYTFVVASRRRRDFCNLYSAFKAGEDGIVDAGLIRDDSAWEMRVELEIEHGKKPAVIVTLEGAR